MRAKPPEVDETDLLRVIQRDWRFDAASIQYQAVGAGSYHWIVVDEQGTRRFATVDDLETKPWLGGDAETSFLSLKGAYEIARTLRDNGLDFVVGPIPTIRDEVVVRLNEQFTVAVFPFVDGRAGNFDDMPQGHERRAALLMWARLHAATSFVSRRASARGFGVPGRADLEAAINEADRPWAGGPHSLEARDWIASNRHWLIRALAIFDDLAQTVVAKDGDLVITHGEPHGANVIKSGAMRYLIDWDTVALALPERDLWMLDDGTRDAFRAYVDASGHRVDPKGIAFYGMAWHLTDIALFVRQLRATHLDDADSQKAVENLDVAARRLTAHMPAYLQCRSSSDA